MSANIGSMIYVGEKPWHGLGVRYAEPPRTSAEIIAGAKLAWDVAATPMYTNLHPEVGNYHAIYRTDDNRVLGVVNKRDVRVVQNTDTFNAIGKLLGNEIDVETAASLGDGEKVFGCFKVHEGFKLIDDDMEQYIVVLNDHLSADGKVTIVNTPIRVVCQNTLSAALSNNRVKYRVACTADKIHNDSIAAFIKDNVMGSQKALTIRAEAMLKQRVSREDVERILDELFPYLQVEGESTHDRANETVSMVRETFLTQCMDADNLQNYKGTHYQVFNALTDFCEHYYMSSDAGVDLEARMASMPGLSTDYRMSRYLKLAKRMVA